MQTGRDFQAAQGLVLGEFFLNPLEHGHRAARPFHTELALGGQFQILDIVVHIVVVSFEAMMCGIAFIDSTFQGANATRI